MKKITLITIFTTSVVWLGACSNVTETVTVTDNTLVETSVSETEERTIEETNPSETQGETTEAKVVTFTDSLGREVTVSNPNRVVTLLGSFCDEWIAAGGSVVGTASDSFTSYDFGFDDSVVDIGNHAKLNPEQIIAVEPDFVIASGSLDSHVELLETLENAGITVAYFDVSNFDDYLDSLKIFTQITGREDLYEQNGTNIIAEIEQAKSQIDGRQPKVLFIRAASSNIKAKGSKGTVGGEILADLDVINIADSDSILEDLSLEAVVVEDPEYIFVTTMGSDTETALSNVEEFLTSNPIWNELTAVKNGNYYVIDKALYNSKPNARWGEAYQQLADILYPQN